MKVQNRFTQILILIGASLLCSYSLSAKDVQFDDYVSIYKKRTSEDKINILYIGGGSYHDELRKAAVLRKLLEVEQGYFVTYTEDYDVFVNGLQKYDMILINSHISKLTDIQYTSLLNAVREGMPLLGIHAASASFRNSGSKARPEFYKMLGAKFDHHPKMHEFEIQLKQGNGLIDATYANYSVMDELYYYSNYQSENNVLLTASFDNKPSPMAWTKNYGKGKVFFTAIGHSPAVSADKNFQNLILFATEWLLQKQQSKDK